MHDLQSLKDIDEQEAATRALNAIRKSAELGKANRCKSDACGAYNKHMTQEEAAELVKRFHAADPK